ncbi:MAG: hypothetical protein QM426_02990 [Euryarchaeota archaeon]|nr:hypothetical protein [Euryarchaeota archaeon]
MGDEEFEDLISHLVLPGIEKPSQDKKNSIEISEVSVHSVLYALKSSRLNPEEGRNYIKESLQAIRDRVKEINPEFIGHIKLSLKLPDSMIKGSVTSSEETTQGEFITRRNEKLELRLLSVIKKSLKTGHRNKVESTLEEELNESKVAFEKKKRNRTAHLGK